MVNGARALDRSFRALGHPARRRIVERLARGPATVAAATEGLAISKPAVTKHLKILEDAGLVVRAVEGRTHRLHLDGQPLVQAAAWIERHRLLWEAKFDLLDRFLAEQDGLEGGGRGPATAGD
jgi:DNA-binding transcriptional ArsR family regulator